MSAWSLQGFRLWLQIKNIEKCNSHLYKRRDKRKQRKGPNFCYKKKHVRQSNKSRSISGSKPRTDGIFVIYWCFPVFGSGSRSWPVRPLTKDSAPHANDNIQLVSMHLFDYEHQARWNETTNSISRLQIVAHV